MIADAIEGLPSGGTVSMLIIVICAAIVALALLTR